MFSSPTRIVHPSELGCTGQQPMWLSGVVPHRPRLAVIGARAASRSLETIVDLVVSRAATNQFSLISGGAIGVDTMAHKAALSHDCPQLAVLPCTRFDIYPPANEPLFAAILGRPANGVVYSLADGAKKHRRVFASRNRIIVAMATHVVVVQAAMNSGSYRTGLLALSKKIPTLVVDAGLGCRSLAAKGARMIAADDMTSNAEILDAFLQNREIESLATKLWPPELEMLKRVALVAGAQGFGSGDLLDPLFGLMEITRALALGLILEVGPDRYVVASPARHCPQRPLT